MLRIAMVVTVLLLATVALADDDANHTELFLRDGGLLNGAPIDGTHYTIEVQPGEDIIGQINVTIVNTHPSSAVVPVAATVIWGDRVAQPWLVTGHVTPGTHDLVVPVDRVAPMMLGSYEILVASRGEFTAGQIMSATNWAFAGGDQWYNGDDLGWDWTELQWLESRSNGVTHWNIIQSDGASHPSFQGATWVGVEVIPEPLTMSLLGLGGLTLLRRRRPER